MLHILTVHHRDPRFAPLQLAALHRHLSGPVRTWAVLDAVPDVGFDRTVTCESTQHGPRLDALAKAALQEASDDDVLVFLDGDAWPVADLDRPIADGLAEGALVAVRRDESRGAGWPHPLFTAVPVDTWEELDCSWVPQLWPDPTVPHRWDVGVGVLAALTEHDWRWQAWTRRNRTNPHRLFLALYGPDRPLIWHHGAGFRAKASGTDRTVADRERNETLAEEWLTRATENPRTFWEALV